MNGNSSKLFQTIGMNVLEIKGIHVKKKNYRDQSETQQKREAREFERVTFFNGFNCQMLLSLDLERSNWKTCKFGACDFKYDRNAFIGRTVSAYKWKNKCLEK